jgi:N-acetylmuramoyl-L-alanine amidase
MQNIIAGLIKMIVCSGMLTAYYWLFLRNKSYHQFNRFFLLLATVVSLLTPFVLINLHYNRPATNNPGIQLLQVLTQSSEYLDEIIVTNNQPIFSTDQWLLLSYGFVSALLLIMLIAALVKIAYLYRHNEHVWVNKIKLVNTHHPSTPFSFFSCIFWNNKIDVSSATGQQILQHELTHVRQRHSADKLFINLVLVICWCNPFYWLIKKELSMLHEFIADKQAVQNNNTQTLAGMILQVAYPTKYVSLTNPFFYSPIKRRLAMIVKKQPNKAGYAARLLAIPVLLLLTSAFTFKSTFTLQPAPQYEGPYLTVILDAGHGGQDYGAASIDGQTKEKQLALTLAKKVQELNTNPNIRIILSRANDQYLSPPERVAFAKAQQANLFISIHLNAAPKANQSTGMTVLVSNSNNDFLANSRLLASAIIQQFSGHYGLPVTQQPVQKQQGIWILKANQCPAVLIEAGFINHQKDLSYLQSAAGQQSIAMNILNSIENYANASKQQPTAAAQPMELPSGKAYTPTLPNKQTATAVKMADSTPVLNALYIVDGVTMDQAGAKKFLQSDPAAIKQIAVYKGEQAIKLYGEAGKNGVIAIETKPAAANEATELQTPEVVFTSVEQEADFAGGLEAWKKYLLEKLDVSIPVKEGWSKGTYKIIVQFKVDVDGNISNVNTVNYAGTKTAAHCINLVQQGPAWQPAVQNGRKVNSWKKQPITFIIN